MLHYSQRGVTSRCFHGLTSCSGQSCAACVERTDGAGRVNVASAAVTCFLGVVMPRWYTKVSRNGANLVEILFTRWNVPEIPTELALVGCFACSAAFAAVLTTQWGQRATLNHLWIASFVVLGVAIVLAWFALVNLPAALQALAFFVSGGTPMLIRAAYLYLRHKQQHIAYLQQRAQQASVQEFED